MSPLYWNWCLSPFVPYLYWNWCLSPFVPSLPELAAALAAARRGENDIVLGNVIGSNLFNTLAVVGLAGTIHPFRMGTEVIWRDGSVMLCLTFSLFVFGHGWRGRTGRINRWEGALLIMVYMAYMAWLGFGR